MSRIGSLQHLEFALKTCDDKNTHFCDTIKMNCHDTLLEIFNVIDNPTTLQRCRCVCQRWNKIILKSQAYRKLFASLNHNLLDNLKSKKWKCAFRYACKYGHLEIVQWLVETFGLTTEDVKSDNNLAFQWACGYGHLEVAQWLVRTFDLTAEDIRNDNYVFGWACFDRYLKIAQWLVETFKLTAEDVRSDSTFQWACEFGHLEIAQWLVETFKLTVKDIRSLDNYAFQLAHINKHSNVTNWLTTTYGICAEDL
jgi:hypothetical protein